MLNDNEEKVSRTPILIFPVLFVILLCLLIGGGFGVGWVLRWLVPSIDVGFATLIGEVAVITSIDFVRRLLRWTNEVYIENRLDDLLHGAERPPPVTVLEPETRRRRRKRE
jgi:hypothetical protein